MTVRAIEGVLTAMVTPFAEDGSLDLPAARGLASDLLAHGSHGVVIAGTTGESPTLADDEVERLLTAVLEEIGDRALVVCGAGSNNTHHAVDLTERVVAGGAHAVLSVTPYYNRPNDAGLRAHYAAVSEAAGETPVVLYNIPSRSVLNIGPDLLAELAADNRNIVAVKQANNDEMGPIDGLSILAGNDDIFLTCLQSGGTGGILVASHLVGDEMRAVYDAFHDDDIERARAIHDALAPAYSAMTVAPPASTAKRLLADEGGIPSAAVRLPMVALTDEESAQAARAVASARERARACQQVQEVN